MSNERNHTIDFFRYICALMVIAIHTHPLTDINQTAGYICTNVIPRIAVPFFFAVSGYYFFRETNSGKQIKRIKHVIIVYLMWSAVYYLPMLLLDIVKGKSYISLAKELVKKLFLTGTSFHLWYFCGLIYSMCIVMFLKRIKKVRVGFIIGIVLYAVGCIGISYYQVAVNIPVLGAVFRNDIFLRLKSIFCIGYPFFYMGYLINKILENKEEVCSNGKVIMGASVSAFVFICEVIAINYMKLSDNIITTFGLYPLTLGVLILCINNPVRERVHGLGRMASSVSAFMYYSHVLFIWCVEMINKILKIHISETPMFLFAAVGTTICGIIIYKSNIRFKKLFGL